MLDFIFGKTVGKYMPGNQNRVRALVDRFIEYASQERFTAQLAGARDFYFSRTGKANEDDHDFVQRMNTFLEWFIFDYRPDGVGGSSLFDRYLNETREEIPSEELVWWIAVSRQVHSLFLIKSRAGGVIRMRDLAGGRSYVVTGDDHLEKGDILEARLVVCGGGCYFTYTHCLHPKESYGPIKSEVKKWRGKPLTDDFFLKLQGMQLKWRRFRQISIDDIYRM